MAQLASARLSEQEVSSSILSDLYVCFDFPLIRVAIAIALNSCKTQHWQREGGKGCTVGFHWYQSRNWRNYRHYIKRLYLYFYLYACNYLESLSSGNKFWQFLWKERVLGKRTFFEGQQPCAFLYKEVWCFCTREGSLSKDLQAYVI